MAIAIDREYGLFIGGEPAEFALGEVRELTEPELYLETKSVIVSTGARPINPFGL